VWVQADEDKGRISSDNQIVDEATPDAPQKVFLGCPNGIQDVKRLFGLLQSRAIELERGVQYLYLGSKDRVYQPLMMSRNFFGFVEKVTGASVQIDAMTGDFLRMDGRGGHLLQPQRQYDLTNGSPTEVDRASLAEELVRLQIELYRDHCIREQSWIFGRDWTILVNTPSTAGSAAMATSTTDASDKSSSATASVLSSSFGQIDAKIAAHGAAEIPSVVAQLGHGGNVAAHAAIILYRFVTLMDSTQWKIREAVLACIFLANKCQKVNKWKRLEVVLEAAYETFYPGTKFDKDKEDVLVLEERVIAAEQEILQTLEYDIFWRDIECIVTAATGGGRMKADFVGRVMDFAFSGPVLGAGAELWLKYGIEYVFAASSAFLEANLDYLLPALGVIPLKVLAAAELLSENSKIGRPPGKKIKSHPLLEGSKDRLKKCIPRIREACVATMNKVMGNVSSQALSGASIVDQRYKLISEQGRRRCAIRNIPQRFVKDHIVPVIDAVAAESACNVYIEQSPIPGQEDVILDGPWRSVVVAEHLLRTKAIGPLVLSRAVDASASLKSGTKIQAKIEPGCIDARDILTTEGWEGTLQAQMSNQAVKDRRIGGKSCIAGKVSESALRRSGLRWWIPLKNGASPSGSISDIFLVRENEFENFKVLASLARAVGGNSAAFPKLTSLVNDATNGSAERFTAVSLQQWPSEKVGTKEIEKAKAKKGKTMQMGISAAALQEMQLLTQLHGLISNPFGHPNFVLPVGIAVAAERDRKEMGSSPEEEKKDSSLLTVRDPMFSLFRSNEENEKVAEKDKKIKCQPHLLLHPTPFILNRFLSKKHLNGIELRSHKALMTAWFHDLLSALVHCHSNHVVMRSIQSDQIVVDHNGTAKIGGLYRCTVLSEEWRETSLDLLQLSRSPKTKGKNKDDDEDFSNNPFVAPETLLGAPKHTKEGDVWAIGSLLANLLLGKPLFAGKDRNSLLTSQFKIVGTPARNNFEEAAKFPHYSKPIKKYPRGVEKALGHMLKDESAEHGKAIDLIARMLHLDPRKRCTASEALSHDFMVEYMENSSIPAFRDEYVEQWMRLKEVSLISRRDSKKAKQQMSSKRKAMLMAARDSGDDEDDLYDIDELLEQPVKKIKN